MKGLDAPPLRVLVVDDNEDTAASLAFLSGAWGPEVRVAHDGPAALDAALEFRPDAVVLDVGLPRMDGFEVARRLRLVPGLERALLIASTGFSGEGDHLLAAEAGFQACDAALQTFGGYGYAKEFYVERLWREVRLYKIAPIPQQMALNYLSEHVLGLPRSY